MNGIGFLAFVLGWLAAFAVMAWERDVGAAREDFPDHFEQWEREVSA